GNVCILYEVDSCNAPRRYHDSYTLPGSSKTQGYCAAYRNSTESNIIACVCQDENCNQENNIQSIMDSTTGKSLSGIISMGTWQRNPDHEHTKQLLECLRKNVRPVYYRQEAGNDVSPAATTDNSEEKEESWLLGEYIRVNYIVFATVGVLVLALVLGACIIWLVCREDRKEKEEKEGKSSEKSTSGSV
ncbi:hypothetical protein GCK32_016844, partial [Trichostrongylus colubriformis]